MKGGNQWVARETFWRGANCPSYPEATVGKDHSKSAQEVLHTKSSEEQESFGKDHLGFPTERRPIEHRRSLLTKGTFDFRTWLEKYPVMLGSTLENDEQRNQVRILFETWKDMFVEDVRLMPATDLIEHYIPTYPNAIPVVARPVLYTAEEIQWQKDNFPAPIEAGIITSCHSPWSARSRFPRKSNETLRMVHVFCKLNNATIKAHHSMRRLVSTSSLQALPMDFGPCRVSTTRIQARF